jgi:hypothetical protein
MRTKEMNHVVTETSPGELGVGCSCGKRFPTRNAAELHASDQNLIEKNEAKAKKSDKAEAHAAELAKQPKEPTEPEKEPEDESDSTPDPAPDEKPQPPAVQPSANSTSSETPQALSPSNLPLDLENLSLNQINFIGQTMAKSGMFPDVTDGAKALVKILAGKEIGVTPFQAMTNIHIIQGKATMGANLMAAKVKGSGKYEYRVMDLTSETCSILFRQRDSLAEGGWADLGKFTYSLEDAKRAGLVKTGSSWEKYPSNMLFARAISSGVRIYCPDVFNGNLVYVPGNWALRSMRTLSPSEGPPNGAQRRHPANCQDAQNGRLQNRANSLVGEMSGSAWRVTSMGIGESNRYAAPTAQEITDQSPGVVNVHRDNTGWWCSGADLGVSYDTMAEALAALWLQTP